jgi:imidazolonepropionase-like amidohydrolase
MKDEIVTDVYGQYLIPGLIDSHVHVVASTINLSELRSYSQSYLALSAARNMNDMLNRGFTTVRDTGGADFGLAKAQKDGLIKGPRLLFCGKAISQTGGHGDDRKAGENSAANHQFCGSWAQIADGVDEVRLAVRNEIRRGADHIKIMASGGVASPTDRVDSTGYSIEELEAVVIEAQAANRYVAAHAYTAKAINRALEAGVRSIEHGNLLDDSSIALFKKHDAFLVMNLVTYWAMATEGKDRGLDSASLNKISHVLDGGYKALELATRSKIRLAFGTDLLGSLQKYQNREFEIRADFQSAIEILRSATTVGAELVGLKDSIGSIKLGSYADLIILNQDPLENIKILARPEKFLAIFSNGEIVKENT